MPRPLSLLCSAFLGGSLVALAPNLALAGVCLALVLCVAVPARAARANEDSGAPRPLAGALAETLALLVGAGLVAVFVSSPAAAGATLLYLALGSLCLAGVATLRGGQALATGLGLVALAFPYLASALFGAWDPEFILRLALHSPLPVLCGTCNELDVLRGGSLYQAFPAAQRVPYAYPTLLAAISPPALLAAFLWLPRWPGLSERLASGSRRAAPALSVLLVLGAANLARGQGLFPPPSAPDANAAGDLATRVRLGYYLPRLEGFVRMDSAFDSTLPGADFTWNRDVDLNQAFVVPTFEVELAWPNTGSIRVQYMENEWKGETQTNKSFKFEEEFLLPFQTLDTRYHFRTVALTGGIDIPIASFITAKLLTTTRYIKHEVKLRSASQPFARRNSQEAIVPTFGAGVDVFIWNVISAYGDVQWLDFRTSLLGAEDDRWAFRYREWRAGVRLELVKHAHVMVEYYSLFLVSQDGKKNVEEYKVDLQGVRVMVAIQF
jgi:hypothetical protein